MRTDVDRFREKCQPGKINQLIKKLNDDFPEIMAAQEAITKAITEDERYSDELYKAMRDLEQYVYRYTLRKNEIISSYAKNFNEYFIKKYNSYRESQDIHSFWRFFSEAGVYNSEYLSMDFFDNVVKCEHCGICIESFSMNLKQIDNLCELCYEERQKILS